MPPGRTSRQVYADPRNAFTAMSWSESELAKAVECLNGLHSKAITPETPVSLILVYLQKINCMFETCGCIEDQMALATRCFDESLIDLCLGVVIQGDALSYIAIHTFHHWTYSVDACTYMISKGVIETLVSILPMAKSITQCLALRVIVRLLDQVRGSISCVLRPRLLRVLCQSLDKPGCTKFALTIVNRVAFHPKGLQLLGKCRVIDTLRQLSTRQDLLEDERKNIESVLSCLDSNQATCTHSE